MEHTQTSALFTRKSVPWGRIKWWAKKSCDIDKWAWYYKWTEANMNPDLQVGMHGKVHHSDVKEANYFPPSRKTYDKTLHHNYNENSVSS
jgi:hypothetical protein